MNTRWLKQNLGMVLFGLLFLGALGGLGWQLRKAVDEQKNVELDLSAQDQTLRGLQSERPYPSQENIQKIKNDIEKVRALEVRLQQHLAKKLVPLPQEQSEVDFTAFLTRSVDSLSMLAFNTIIVPQNYKFGFSRYEAAIPCKEPGVNKQECMELLGKQIYITEHLIKLMITNKISHLDYIHRAEAEPGSSADSLGVPVTGDQRSLYITIPFEIRFQSGPDEFQAFVNSLTHSEWLFAIRQMKVDVVGSVAPMAALTPETAKDRKVSVTMRLDVIEFPQYRPRPVKPNPGR
jgi:hypothetical protein